MTFYKTTIVLEVLTNEPLVWDSWGELAHLVTEGHASGDVKSEVTEEVDHETMKKLLDYQGSDPFFLADEECLGCGTESYTQYCEECAPKQKCPHGAILGDCNSCDIEGDLAFDAAREGR